MTDYIVVLTRDERAVLLVPPSINAPQDLWDLVGSANAKLANARTLLQVWEHLERNVHDPADADTFAAVIGDRPAFSPTETSEES